MKDKQMLSGRAFYIQHPRRKEQDFVCCNIVRVAKSIEQSLFIRWNIKVTMIRYEGNDALPINVSLSDLWDMLSETARKKLVIGGGMITS